MTPTPTPPTPPTAPESPGSSLAAGRQDRRPEAIRVTGLSKRYRLGLADEGHDTLARTLLSAIASPLRNFRRLRSLTAMAEGEDDPSILWALRDVSLSVAEGEIVGIIGRNGAGKSTLLKILSRITHPTTGRIEFRGRVSSLLEVGTGFHPELTGRENTYLNGSILGMSRQEIDRKFDEIAAFSEIESFLDTPVKRYSSGMRLRLAFSVAAHLEPEILLIDEVLAVGDSAFQQKCVGRIGSVARSGRTVIFVSHNLALVSRLCDRGIVLENGGVSFDGGAVEAVDHYRRSLPAADAAWTPDEDEEADGEAARLLAAKVTDSKGAVRNSFSDHEAIDIHLEVEIRERIEQVRVGFGLETEWEMLVMRVFHNDVPGSSDLLEPGTYSFRARVPPHFLAGQVFFVSPCAGVHKKRWLFEHQRILSFSVMHQERNPVFSYGGRPGLVLPDLEWSVESPRGSLHGPR
ncbi:MAG: ABC transporter ATP-binding protein [Acidobacteriota bacterium]